MAQTIISQTPEAVGDYTVTTTVYSDGSTCVTPVPTAGPELNAATIEVNLIAQLQTIEIWIANNPNGAVLTAAQTLVLARMVAGLTRNALQLTATVGGS